MEALRRLDAVVKGKGISAGEALYYLVAAYNGAGPSGVAPKGASSTFVYPPLSSPIRVDWQGGKTPVVVSLVIFNPNEKKAVIFAVEMKLEDITPGFLAQFAEDAWSRFKSTAVSGGMWLPDVVREAAGRFSGAPQYLK